MLPVPCPRVLAGLLLVDCDRAQFGAGDSCRRARLIRPGNPLKRLVSPLSPVPGPAIVPDAVLAELTICALRPLTGPNLWFNRPAWEFQVAARDFDQETLRPLADWLSDTLAGAAAAPRFGRPAFPAITLHSSGCRHPVDAAPPVVTLLADLSLGLQALAESPVTRSALAQVGDGQWMIAVEYEEQVLGRAAIETARELIEAAGRNELLDAIAFFERFRELADELRLGVATGSIVSAAAARGIPHLRLDAESLVQLGQGLKQRRVRMATTDGTGHVANFVAIDKELTKRLLRRIGLPVPLGRPVVDADDACAAAAEIGGPVVVKPQDADFGNGASIRLTRDEQVRSGYSLARRWSERVLVERFVPGSMHRLLVVGSRLVAAVRLGPARVTGDGIHTLCELVEIANGDPRRGPSNPCPLRPIELGSEEQAVLAEQDLFPELVPVVGRVVPLRRDVFFSRGGTIDDVTDRVHPDTVQAAIDAVRVVGLDVAGIDLIADDIERPLAGQEAALLEINAEPSIALHMAPWCDPPRPVPQAIVEMLFPPGDDGRLPLVAVVGAARRAVAAGIVEQSGAQGLAVGHATSRGAWLAGRPIATAPARTRDAVDSLWIHPRTAAAVVEVTLGEITREGLPFDRCDVLVLAGFDGDLEAEESPTRSRAWTCLLDSLHSPGGLVLPCSQSSDIARCATQALRVLRGAPSTV